MENAAKVLRGMLEEIKADPWGFRVVVIAYHEATDHALVDSNLTRGGGPDHSAIMELIIKAAAAVLSEKTRMPAGDTGRLVIIPGR